MSINWIIWKPKKRYGLYTIDIIIASTGTDLDTGNDVTLQRNSIPVDIKVEIITEHTMGYEVRAVEIVSGGEYFVEDIRNKILQSVPNFLESRKVLLNE